MNTAPHRPDQTERQSSNISMEVYTPLPNSGLCILGADAGGSSVLGLLSLLSPAKLACMKAIVINRLGGPEVLELQEVPKPDPKPGEALVRVEAVGINFADIMTAQGGYPGAPKPPLVAGREFCGTRMSDRQRVMGYMQWGAFAERVAALPQLLWPVPKE